MKVFTRLKNAEATREVDDAAIISEVDSVAISIQPTKFVTVVIGEISHDIAIEEFKNIITSYSAEMHEKEN